MNLLPCEFQVKCQPCTLIPFCVFLLLSKEMKKGKCVNEADAKKYPNSTILKIVEDCNTILYISSARPLYNLSPEQTIRNRVLKSYNASISPESIDKKGTLVQFRFNVFKFNLMEKRDEASFWVNGTLHLEWIDTRLSWHDQNDSDGTKYEFIIQYNEKEIWSPKIIIQNSSNLVKMDHGRALLNAHQNGKVTFDLPLRITSPCRLQQDMLRWPFVTHTCNFTMTLDLGITKRKDTEEAHKELILNSITSKFMKAMYVNVDNLTQGQDWKLLKAEASRSLVDCPNCEDPFVVFFFTLQRKTRPNIKYVIWFTVFIMFAAYMTMSARPGKVLKIALASILILMMTIHISYLGSRLPSSRLNYPLIFVLSDMILLLMGLSWIVSLALLFITSIQKPFPTGLQWLISNELLLRLLRLRHMQRQLHRHRHHQAYRGSRSKTAQIKSNLSSSKGILSSNNHGLLQKGRNHEQGQDSPQSFSDEPSVEGEAIQMQNLAPYFLQAADQRQRRRQGHHLGQGQIQDQERYETEREQERDVEQLLDTAEPESESESEFEPELERLADPEDDEIFQANPDVPAERNESPFGVPLPFPVVQPQQPVNQAMVRVQDSYEMGQWILLGSVFDRIFLAILLIGFFGILFVFIFAEEIHQALSD